jgi:hypothetical protein
MKKGRNVSSVPKSKKIKIETIPSILPILKETLISKRSVPKKEERNV